MNRKLRKTIIRDIRGSLGRYLAIFFITALGVGFFAGLRITNAAMRHTMDSFLSAQNFHDIRVILPAGVSEDLVKAFETLPTVREAESGVTLDVVWQDEEETQYVLKTHLLPERINLPKLKKGRMPESADECLIDSRFGGPDIGEKLILASDNNGAVSAALSQKEYTVVGKADSPLYINFERGSTSAGNGSVAGFVYLTEDGFAGIPWTELYLKLDTDEALYSDAYNARVKAAAEEVESILTENGASGYVLDRNSNIGYVCFESDSEIVGQVAAVFPLFFILVAILVTMTTMGRFVEERRTEIGTLKALGYSGRAIAMKFMIYAGSAAIAGCLAGYAGGIHLFPGVIWITYRIMYITLPMQFVWSWPLFGISLGAALLCSIGTTWVVTRVSLREAAAQLMRPKAPRAGKRVILERISPIWKRLSFMRKISIRNIFRYKGRLFMMILGVGGCTALLLTGLGLKDSIAGFADTQFEEIEIADASLVIRELPGQDEAAGEDPDLAGIPAVLAAELAEKAETYLPYYEAVWTLLTEDKTKEVRVIAPSDYEKLSKYVLLNDVKGHGLAAPGVGEAIISVSLAERQKLSVGDRFTIRSDAMETVEVTVSGIFENHVYDYVYVLPETLLPAVGGSLPYNSVFLNYPPNADQKELTAALSENPAVAAITLYEELKERVGKMMQSLNYVVLLVIFFAAALAFVVIYNLTNINITERIREIATVKVLGFYPGETARYVFRENTLLSFFGAVIGLILGVLLHRFVMSRIIVDMVYFSVIVRPVSFLLAVALTMIFNVLVCLFMRGRLEKIDMAESLKSVE